MRPIKLTLEGFTSFRKRQTLDLSTLDLFAITGATGAGKSSLLDAMTFALYGKVARFGKKNSSTELVSQGATELKVEFQFVVQQTEYKVIRTWKYRPSSPKTGFLLDKLKQGTWERCDRSEKIEDILRMNFDTFIRVILLPQGQFDHFLKNEPRKRRELLRQLAGFELFEQMRQEASQRAKQYKAERETIAQWLANIQAPTEDEVHHQQTQLTTFEQEIPTLESNAANAQRVLDDEKRVFEQIQHLSELQQHLAKHKEEAATITVLEQRLQQAQKADRLAGDWERVKAARHRHDELQRVIETARANFRQALQGLHAQRSMLMDDVGQLLKMAEIRVNAAVEHLMAAEQGLAKTTLGGTRLAQLKHISATLIQWQEKLKQVQEARYSFLQTTEQLQAAQLQCNDAASALENAKTTLQAAKAHNDAVMQKNHAAALRLSLHTDENCPVCGGIYPDSHQLPPLPEIAFVEFEPLQKRQAEAEYALQTALTAKTRVKTTRANLHQYLPDKEAELATLQQQISQVLQTDEWEAEALKRELETLQEMDRQYHDALKNKEKAQAELEKTKLAHQFAQENYENTLSQHQDSAEELERQQHQLQQAQIQIHQQTEGMSYDILSQTIERYEEHLAVRLNQAHKSYQAARVQFIQIEEMGKKTKQELELAGYEKEQCNTAWQVALQAAGFTEENFLAANALPEQQAEWTAKIRHHREQNIALETNIKSVAATIGERTTDESQIKQRHNAKLTADNKLKQANEQRVQLSIWLQRATEKQQQVKQLSTKQAALKAQEETYYTLSLKLRTDEFQAYLLEHLEEELVTRATVMLWTLTDSRYALKRKDGGYWVEDHWNGGEIRRVQTLSGGEMFATSLAMALALSEKLSMGVELGCLFLDEGFGTLDAETLESVTQILESLRQQDRLIGVITHIPALAERLPTQVKVYKSPEGSRLEVEAL